MVRHTSLISEVDVWDGLLQVQEILGRLGRAGLSLLFVGMLELVSIRMNAEYHEQLLASSTYSGADMRLFKFLLQ